MLLSKVECPLFLNETYPNQNFMLMSTGDEDAISCFVHWVDNSELLEAYWSQVSSSIAIEYQSNLTSIFASWNIYLVFICKTPVDRSLRYQIENDRFSMRKIIIDEGNYTEREVINFMNSEIFCADLDLVSEPFEQLPEDGSSVFRTRVLNLGDLPTTQNESAGNTRLKQLKTLMQWNHEN